MSLFPTAKGTYVLWLNLPQTRQITIGKRGIGDFPRGYYAYIGSAFGSGGLNGRLKHHLVPAKRPHWHIDYLKVYAKIDEVWTVASEDVYEHQWAEQLFNLADASAPMRGFGSSDCRCIAHLIHLPHKPQILLCEAMQVSMI
jgi:Uri superfamily endonuclease